MKTLIVRVAILATLTFSMHAGQPAVEWTGSQQDYDSTGDGPFTLGCRFRADSDLLVTALGAYDDLSNGLLFFHTIAIWTTAGGVPLISATVPSGTSAPLQGHFRYVDVAGLTLSAGTEYVIGASDYGILGNMGDVYCWDAQGFASTPGVTWFHNREVYTPSGGLAFPAFGEDNPLGFSVFGPNFQFVPVPEPSAFALLCFGMSGVFLVNYARRKAA